MIPSLSMRLAIVVGERERLIGNPPQLDDDAAGRLGHLHRLRGTAWSAAPLSLPPPEMSSTPNGGGAPRGWGLTMLRSCCHCVPVDLGRGVPG